MYFCYCIYMYTCTMCMQKVTDFQHVSEDDGKEREYAAIDKSTQNPKNNQPPLFGVHSQQP